MNAFSSPFSRHFHQSFSPFSRHPKFLIHNAHHLYFIFNFLSTVVPLNMVIWYKHHPLFPVLLLFIIFLLRLFLLIRLFSLPLRQSIILIPSHPLHSSFSLSSSNLILLQLLFFLILILPPIPMIDSWRAARDSPSVSLPFGSNPSVANQSPLTLSKWKLVKKNL